jgi:hypothetical protein
MVAKHIWNSMLMSTVLAAGLLMAASGARAERDWKEGCRQRLESDRAKIDRDAARFGEHSRQVDRDVAKMDATRQWCANHHAEWDHTRFDVGIYFRH